MSKNIPYYDKDSAQARVLRDKYFKDNGKSFDYKESQKLVPLFKTGCNGLPQHCGYIDPQQNTKPSKVKHSGNNYSYSRYNDTASYTIENPVPVKTTGKKNMASQAINNTCDYPIYSAYTGEQLKKLPNKGDIAYGKDGKPILDKNGNYVRYHGGILREDGIIMVHRTTPQGKEYDTKTEYEGMDYVTSLMTGESNHVDNGHYQQVGTFKGHGPSIGYQSSF